MTKAVARLQISSMNSFYSFSGSQWRYYVSGYGVLEIRHRDLPPGDLFVLGV